ncbi:VOC family protein [Suttonella sp. R2A3]|uniref:2-oxoadipate dioxygenase/decarboxylase HglS n=1 Tax=Suttonella sp. R2A3 TaxID=2908648 RepID=UPI001F19A6D8|nr:VOC family protein [Suttonella sp. R2A3]UJF25271.1 VOC family protein [Suttonella sp. R2A3]
MDQFERPAEIRARFSKAMSDMYQQEVPLYGDLMDLVAEVNTQAMTEHPELRSQLEHTGELTRLDMERHGAIRVGTAEELATIRRLFAVMGMEPVGYYDLAPAGVPVHSTAFRALDSEALNISPFRVFTSLLRLELIEDKALRDKAAATLAERDIFTPRVRELIAQCEHDGGLSSEDSEAFVREALETFRWHQQSQVSAALYQELHDQHRLIADVVAFKGPHINHLTPRTLDIDAVQSGMSARGITPKAVVEGPPRRKCPILLRQTSFKALEESVHFTDAAGSHTARFGEIEQRGVALSAKGRALYDQLLNAAREEAGGAPTEANAQEYQAILSRHFAAFPDEYQTLREQGLAFFHYFVTDTGRAAGAQSGKTLDALLEAGLVAYEPLVYEDFLPVSAAGIFQSNLGDDGQKNYDGASNQAVFEQALGANVHDEMAMYAANQQRSIDACLQALNA